MNKIMSNDVALRVSRSLKIKFISFNISLGLIDSYHLDKTIAQYEIT